MSTLYSRELLQALNLSSPEESILLVSGEAISITSMASLINHPRSTLYPYILTLIRRGLLEKISSGKRFLYRKKAFILQTPSPSQTPVPTQNIAFFSGNKELTEAWLRISLQPKKSTVVTIQPNSSLINSIKKSKKNLAKENHQKIISRKIFLDQIVEEGMYELVKNLLPKKSRPGYKNDFSERTSSITLLPSNFFPRSCEIFVLNDSVLILDWEQEVGFEIKNKNFRQMFLGLSILLKQTGRVSNNYEELIKFFS